MGFWFNYGTVGATGGGWSAQPGTLKDTHTERLSQKPYEWQSRSPMTSMDPGRWVSLWSFGMRSGLPSADMNGGAVIGRGMNTPDNYRSWNCNIAGYQSANFLIGTCVDASDVPVANAIVQAFVTATDAFEAQVNANVDGTYSVPVRQSKATPHYLVAYKAGAPDTAGTTVNTLLPTNVDGTTV